MIDPEILRQKLQRVDPGYYREKKCKEIALQLDYILELKKERKAVLLAHNYQRPEIFEVADYFGDSLGLSLKAGDIQEAEVIIFCGVHFMAETAKIVNPGKKVILPNLSAGCSLADSADVEDVVDQIEDLKRIYPDLGVVCYVNTTAAVKAICDSTCTSSNAVEVVKGLPNKTILFIPDKNLAKYVADNVPEKKVIAWDGYCYVHHELDPESIRKVKIAYPNLKVLVHPECRDDVVAEADAVMSTSAMVDYAQKSEAKEFLAVTECGLSDLLTVQVPQKQFFRACKVCRFMKMITVENIIESLENLQPEIKLPENTLISAKRSIDKMFELTALEKLSSH